MLYDFRDTVQTFCDIVPPTVPLPSEALCFNGVWIDSEISLYRTLYVSGRESFSADINETALESLDGSVFLRSRLLPRTITVGYQITASTAAQYMEAFNRLCRLMSGKQVQIIFADEPDKYYIGTCRTVGAPEPGRLSVKAEMEIYCADPCKYSVDETTVFTDSRGLFVVDYLGSYPARPTFEAVFSGNAKQVVFTCAGAVVTAGDGEASAYTFIQNDVLTIDCSAAEISLNDISTPGLGSIANQYENMILSPGENTITPSTVGAAPVFKMRFREAWL